MFEDPTPIFNSSKYGRKLYNRYRKRCDEVFEQLPRDIAQHVVEVQVMRNNAKIFVMGVKGPRRFVVTLDQNNQIAEQDMAHLCVAV